MGVLTRIRPMVALTVLKTCFAGKFSTVSVFKILILSSRSDTSGLRVGVAIFAGLVSSILVGWCWLSSTESIGFKSWPLLVRKTDRNLSEMV